MAKLSAYPQSPRNVLNVYAYLLSLASSPSSTDDLNINSLMHNNDPPDPETYYLSEGAYLSRRNSLLKTETEILRRLGFETHVALPYTLAVNYLQALDVFREQETGQKVARRTFEHLTTALYSPQLLYLTHQPTALATAGIYLAAREVGVKLPALEWWTVFDVDREDLGFLVLAIGSMKAFAESEKEKGREREREREKEREIGSAM